MNLLLALLWLLLGIADDGQLTFEQRFVRAAKVQRGESPLFASLARFGAKNADRTYEQAFVLAAKKQKEDDLAHLPELIKQAEERRQRLAQIQSEQSSQSMSEKYGTPPTYPIPVSPHKPVFITYKPVFVNGYFRKDGTYVRPHQRSLPGRRR